MIECREITNRAEWLAWRRQDVTASPIGALFGVHPYTTALKLYAEKRGVEFPDPDNRVLRRGRWLESAVATAVGELRPDWKIEPARSYFRDPDLRLGATPDFFIRNDPRGVGVLQCKTVAPSVYARDWNGGKDIPLWVTLQTLTEMHLTDAAFGAVAVLLVDAFNMDCVVLEVPRHAGGEEKIREKVKQFWIAVEQGIEPDPNFGMDADVIKALTATPTPLKQIDLTGNNELPQLLADRAGYMAVAKDCEAKKTAIEAQIRHIMDDAEIATGLDGWRITYKMQERDAYTVAARKSRVLLIQDKRARE
jgi:predicted phage-related endonuclease